MILTTHLTSCVKDWPLKMHSNYSPFDAAMQAMRLMNAAMPSEDAMDDEDKIMYAQFLVQYSIAMSLHDLDCS